MTEPKEKIFANGITSQDVPEKVKDFVLDKLSIKVDDFINWLNTTGRENANKGGWLNLQVKRSKNGKRYVEVDTYEKPPQKPKFEEGEVVEDDLPPVDPIASNGTNIEDIPF